MTFFAPYKTGYVVRIKLTPNAASSGFKGIIDGADGEKYLKASVTAAPEKGKANKDLINMLSRQLKISKQAFSVIFGQTDHYKKIYIDIDRAEEFSKRLQTLWRE